jgi:RND family efflux transporter MFP subunit
MNKSSKRVLTLLILLGVGSFAGYRIWQAYENKAKASNTPGQGGGGGGGRAFGSRGGGRGGLGAGRIVTVSVTKAQSGSVREEIEITGSLRPEEQVDVSAQVTGRVKALTLQIGDFVQRGALIAELEDAELAQQVRRAEAAQQVVRATLEQRRAELQNAQSDLDRSKQLLDAGLLSRQDYETKQTSFRVVQSQLALTDAQGEQALAELNELKIRLAQMKIYAPMSGQIAQRFVDVGAVVSPTTPIVRLVNLATLVTVANVPEGQVSKLRVGNRAIIRVDAFGDTTFEGRVARISPVLDAATRSALVEVEIPNRNGALKAEMFARVTLDLGTLRDAVLIPRDALVYRGQQPGVFVVEQTRPSFKTIETGTTQGHQIEVLGDLRAGTTIVNRGAAMLTEGDQIRIVEEKEAERLDNNDIPESPGAKAKTAIRSGLLGTPAFPK